VQRRDIIGKGGDKNDGVFITCRTSVGEDEEY
jgi:hypothetical protein